MVDYPTHLMDKNPPNNYPIYRSISLFVDKNLTTILKFYHGNFIALEASKTLMLRPPKTGTYIWVSRLACSAGLFSLGE